MKKEIQITSIALPKSWVKRLKKLAHEISLEEEKNITYSELIRRAIKKEYSKNGDK